MRRSAVITCCLLVSVALGACERTQTKSARLEKTGKGKADLTTVKAGAANTAIEVGETAVLSANGSNAAVVELDNQGSAAEVEVPVLIDVKDAKGTSLYKNDVDGLQPSLQQIAYIGKGEKVYWVNDQVLATTPPKSVDVEVGKAKGEVPDAGPRITLSQVRMDSDSSGAYATGVVANESKIVQRNMPIFAVVLKGGKVKAAGRAIVERLDPAPTKKPVTFRIFFVGNPKGGDLKLSVAPTATKETVG